MDSKNRGFSVLELLITMAVFSIVSTIVLAKYSVFTRKVSLKRTVQEMALAIRQAQVYGSSVKEFGGGTSNFYAYGVYFEMSNPKKFIIFADSNFNGNKKYDGGSELVSTFSISSQDNITALCGFPSGGGSEDCALSKLNILFQRPGPSVYLKDGGSGDFSSVKIKITSPDGDEKNISVWKTGQISTQ